MRNIFICCIVVGVGALSIGWRIYVGLNQPTHSPLNTLAFAADLSDEEYQVQLDSLETVLRTTGPQDALQQLRIAAAADERVSRSCHSLAHSLGHQAYIEYAGFAEAMLYQDEICNSGYLHGIIEAHFSDLSDVFTALQTICAAYSEQSFVSWQCYHGVGHGLMFYTANDLPEAIRLCETYATDFARTSCLNGVFMENFNADSEVHTSEFVRPDDPFFPCATQTPEHKVLCYTYAPSYYIRVHPGAYAQALDWCTGGEQEFVPYCIHGVGSQAMKDNIQHPEVVEKLCSQAPGEQSQACIGGMTSLYINHFGQIEPAQELCQDLHLSNQATCQAVVDGFLNVFAYQDR